MSATRRSSRSRPRPRRTPRSPPGARSAACLRAQLGVVVDRARHLRSPTQPRGVHERDRAAVHHDRGCRSSRGWCPQRGSRSPLFAQDRRFTSDDLPTLGRPIRARRTASSSPRRRAGRRCGDQGPAGHRCRAPAWPTREAGPRGRARRNRPPDPSDRRCPPCWPRPPPAAACRGAPRPARRRRGERPALRVHHEQGEIGLGQGGAGLRPDRLAHLVLVREVDPAGVHERERRPFQSASTSLRSRVTPDCSCTTVSRVPERRFTSVDLPTLG